MAANPNIPTLNIPDQVIDSEWQDDIDVDYAIYGGTDEGEGEYISPDSVKDESLDQIKNFQVKLALNGIKRLRQKEKHLLL